MTGLRLYPRGDVVIYRWGATPPDFAYHIHSQVGHRCIGAKAGRTNVPFTQQTAHG